MSYLLDLADTNIDQFSDEFLDWLPDNLHVYYAFEEETMKIIRKGFKHYSSRTIVHVLRHHSATAETDGEWKINNNHSPYLARLFDLCFPHHAGLFEYRVTTKTRKDQNEQARIPNAA
jgi:hypothetical protein